MDRIKSHGLFLPLLTLVLLSAFVGSAIAEDYYHQPVKTRFSEVEIALGKALIRESLNRGIEPPAFDGALSLAAKHLAKGVVNGSIAPNLLLRSRYIETILRLYGCSDANFVLLTGHPNKVRTQAAKLVRQLVSDGFGDRRYSHIGLAVESEEFPFLVVLLAHRPVHLSRFPRKVVAGQSFTLRGTNTGTGDLRMFLAGPDGAIVENRIRNFGERGLFDRKIAFDQGAGDYQIELTARTARGPEVVCLMEINALGTPEFGDGTPRYMARKDYGHPSDESGAEQVLLKMVNDSRKSVEKSLLKTDDSLGNVARKFARELMRKSMTAHRSNEGLLLEDRLQQAGYSFTTAGECLGVAETVFEVYEGMLRSPSHAATLLDPRFNQAGIGVAIDDMGTYRNVYVVVILAEP